MRLSWKCFCAACCLFLILPRLSQAITVTATNPPGTLTANVNVSYSGDCLNMVVGFGDGTQAFPATCPPAAPTCSLNVSHTYATAGTFNVTASGVCGFVNPPNPGSTTVTVGQQMNIISPTPLPAGTLAGVYNFQMQTTGGQLPVRYSLVSGTLPPGLTLSSNGLLSGTPTMVGTFSFWVQVKDFNNQTTQKGLSLTVNLPSVSGPSSMTTTVPRGVVSARTIPYQITASTPINLPLVSTAGVFMAGGMVLDTISSPLTVQLQNGRGQASETITLSPSIVTRALGQGVSAFVYQRSFTLGGALAKATAQSPVVLTTTLTIAIVTEASAPFDIKSIQLYFDKRQIDVTVDRNYPKLKAYADILPLGSGILQGNWTVDGRIISNVVQPLAAGQVITLQTPDIPPLPTFEVGTHQLRFNITHPVTSVPIPTIIYYVSPTESKVALARITLVSPEGGSNHNYSPLTFQWEGLKIPPLYLIEFFNDEKEMAPIFSAFTKRPVYSFPTRGFLTFFEKGSTYYWKVTALNEAKNPVGESERRRFSFRR